MATTTKTTTTSTGAKTTGTMAGDIAAGLINSSGVYTGGSTAKTSGGGSGGSTNPNFTSSGEPITATNSPQLFKSAAGSSPMVDTSQPSPKTVQAQPITNPILPTPTGQDTNLQYQNGKFSSSYFPTPTGKDTGVQYSGGKFTTPKIKSQYEQGFDNATKGGAPKVPAEGQGTSLVSEYSPAKPTNIATSFVDTDPFITSLVDTWQQYISPQNQRASLTDTYSQMVKDSGIEAIDMELINMKNVIEGTEDDIRTEVTKAGGFATDSQVLALTNARNKQLIKNYNTLLDTRNAKEKYLETYIQLEQADRQAADQRFESSFNMGLQIANYQQQMRNNARTQMQWLATNIGFDGLYNSTGGDAYSIGLVEQTLGLPSGGLVSAAQQAEQQRMLQQQKEWESLETERMQQAKLSADIKKVEAELPGSKEYDLAKQNAMQTQVAKAETVLGKVKEANSVMKSFSGIATTGLIGQLTGWIGGTPAKNLKTKLDTITANLSFDTLQEMRNASKTGGALGSVSERELELLGATVASLDISQGFGELSNSLKQVETHYTNWLAANGYSVAPNGDIVPIQ